jgi:competence protein ComEA
LKILLLAAAVIGIATVTFIGRGEATGPDDAGDVLYAVQATGSASATEDVGAMNAVGAAGQGNVIADAQLPPSIGTGAAVSAADSIFVDVYGAVKSPAVYELAWGSRIYEAVEAAGGLTDDADIRYINRATALVDGDRVYVPTRDEAESGKPLPDSAGLVGGVSGGSRDVQGSSDASTSANGQVNINTADSSALQTLNGVGPSTAQKIIDYRESNGPFAKIENLKNVSGIGDKTFEKLKDHICV